MLYAVAALALALAPTPTHVLLARGARCDIDFIKCSHDVDVAAAKVEHIKTLKEMHGVMAKGGEAACTGAQALAKGTTFEAQVNLPFVGDQIVSLFVSRMEGIKGVGSLKASGAAAFECHGIAFERSGSKIVLEKPLEEQCASIPGGVSLAELKFCPDQQALHAKLGTPFVDLHVVAEATSTSNKCEQEVLAKLTSWQNMVWNSDRVCSRLLKLDDEILASSTDYLNAIEDEIAKDALALGTAGDALPDCNLDGIKLDDRAQLAQAVDKLHSCSLSLESVLYDGDIKKGSLDKELSDKLSDKLCGRDPAPASTSPSSSPAASPATPATPSPSSSPAASPATPASPSPSSSPAASPAASPATPASPSPSSSPAASPAASPATAASPSPSPKAPAKGGGGGGSCFAKDVTTVCLLPSPTAKCRRVLMSDLVPGDLVLGRDGPTSVVAVQHKAIDTLAEMLTFHTDAGASVSMTSDHAVFVDGELVAAADATVGSALSTGIITKITKSEAPIINAVTASGTIVADGILAASNPYWLASRTIDTPLMSALVNAILYAVGDVDSVIAGCAKMVTMLATATLAAKVLRSRKVSV